MPISNHDEQTPQRVAWQVGDVPCTHGEYTNGSQEMLDWYRHANHRGGLGFLPKPCPNSDDGWTSVLSECPFNTSNPTDISSEEITLAMNNLQNEGLRTVPTISYHRLELAELIQGKHGHHERITTLLLIDYFKGIRPTNAAHALSAETLEQLDMTTNDNESTDPPQYISDFFNAFGSLVWDHPSHRPLSFMEILHQTRNLNKATPNQKAMRLFYRIYQVVDATICRGTNTLTIIGQSVEWRIRPISCVDYDDDFYHIEGWNARDKCWQGVCVHSLVQHLPVGDHLSTLLRAFSNDTTLAEWIPTLQTLVQNHGGFRYAH